MYRSKLCMSAGCMLTCPYLGISPRKCVRPHSPPVRPARLGKSHVMIRCPYMAYLCCYTCHACTCPYLGVLPRLCVRLRPLFLPDSDSGSKEGIEYLSTVGVSFKRAASQQPSPVSLPSPSSEEQSYFFSI